LVAELDCVGYGLSDGVFDADESDDDEVVLYFLFLGVGVEGVVLFVGEEEGAEGGACELSEFAVEGGFEVFGEFGGLAGGVEVAGAIFDQVVGCALSVNCNFAVFVYNCAHGLGLG
jgi:hypothetical protein